MSSARFERRARLLSAADFRHVFDRAERSRDRYFTVLTRNNGDKHPRLGLAIAKKNAKLAVSRNRIKRIIRESFRNEETLSGVDIVVLATQQTDRAENSELFRSLEKHWRKISSC